MVIVNRIERVLPNSIPPDFKYPPNSNWSSLGGSRTALLLRDRRRRTVIMYWDATVEIAAPVMPS